MYFAITFYIYLHVKCLFFIFAKYVYYAWMVSKLTDFPQKCLMYIPTAKFRCSLLSIFVDGWTNRHKTYLLLMSSSLCVLFKGRTKMTQR